MTILGLLQNQWFKNPVRARQALDSYVKNGGKRHLWIGKALFMGCRSGKMLRKGFGDLCDSIIWEEVSEHISADPTVKLRHDPIHVRRVLELHKPDIVIAFGEIAQRAVPTAIPAPHPAARMDVVTEYRRIHNEILSRHRIQ